MIIDNNGNAIYTGNQTEMQNKFAMMMLDVNMCGIELIYKYNLTEAIKETQEIVVESNWIHNLKSSKNET